VTPGEAALLRRIKILERRIATGGGGGAPAAHATSHSDGGSDELSVLNLGGFPGGTTTFLRADASFATPPSGVGAELDYVEFTSAVNPTATTEATADTVVTGGSVAYDGSTIVLIEFFAVNARPAIVNGANISLWLYDGSGSIGLFGFISASAALGGQNVPVRLACRLTPSNASHTYSIRASVSTGTGLVNAGAGGAGNPMPGYIRIVTA